MVPIQQYKPALMIYLRSCSYIALLNLQHILRLAKITSLKEKSGAKTRVGISVSADIAHIGKTDISVSVIIPAD